MSKRKDLVRRVLRFDPSVTKQQRDAMAVIVPIFFPGKWKSFVLESDSMLEWKYTKDRAVARLDGENCRYCGGSGIMEYRLRPAFDDSFRRRAIEESKAKVWVANGA